ncbi:MAG TPA: putative ABC exporter domain-containing protein [Fimbriimonas sp.]|nr:putative ABC exporter domain-containing protein [Fimbriimonas sp.]
MRPLAFLFTRTFVNGIKRALTSGKRTISLLAFAAYYYFVLMRSFDRGGPPPIPLPGGPKLQMPPTPVIDGAIFGILAFVSIFMMIGVLSPRGGFRPADVDVLFPTPVNPRLVLFFRIVRDYLFTLIAPLFFGLLGGRGTSQSLQFLFQNYPNHGGGMLRMAWVAWMLMSLAWVSLSYGLSLFVGRSDLRSDFNKKIINWGIGIVLFFAAAFCFMQLQISLSWDTALALCNSLFLRIVFFPATAATAVVIGDMTGNMVMMWTGLIVSFAIIALGFSLALTQVGWLYDQAAAKGFGAATIRALRRSGNQYGLFAERARQGKVGKGRLAAIISKRRFHGAYSLVWKELLLQTRGPMSGIVISSLAGMAFAGSMASITRGHGGLGEGALIAMLCGMAFMIAMPLAQGGFLEMLAKVNLLRPLPFTPGTIVFWEVAGKAPIPSFLLFSGAVVAAIVQPGLWGSAVAGLILAIPLLLVVTASILLSVVLFPDYDDPSQRGFGRLVMLLSIAISASPGLALYLLLTLVFSAPSILAAIPSAVVFIAITCGLATLAGNLYAGYNPTE